MSCGAGGTVVTIDDTSTHTSVSNTSSSVDDGNAVFVGNIGVLKGSGPKISPLPSFGSVTFSNLDVHGSALGTSSPTTTDYYEGRKNVIHVGTITDWGTSFVNTQESSPRVWPAPTCADRPGGTVCHPPQTSSTGTSSGDGVREGRRPARAAARARVRASCGAQPPGSLLK